MRSRGSIVVGVTTSFDIHKPISHIQVAADVAGSSATRLPPGRSATRLVDETGGPAMWFCASAEPLPGPVRTVDYSLPAVGARDRTAYAAQVGLPAATGVG